MSGGQGMSGRMQRPQYGRSPQFNPGMQRTGGGFTDSSSGAFNGTPNVGSPPGAYGIGPKPAPVYGGEGMQRTGGGNTSFDWSSDMMPRFGQQTGGGYGAGPKPADERVQPSGAQQLPGGGYDPAGKGGGNTPPNWGGDMMPRFGQQTGGGFTDSVGGGAQQGNPIQWQPSFGGNAPNPFYGAQSTGTPFSPPQPPQPPTYGGQRAIDDPFQDFTIPGAREQRTGGPMTQPPPSFQPAPNMVQQPQVDGYAKWQQENAGMIRPQQDMGRAAWEAQNPQQKTSQGSPFGTPKPPPPMPPNSQPGQATSYWGPPPDGNRDSQFGWNPRFFPGQNEYVTQMYGFLNPQQRGQVDWNNAVQSIGNLSGRQFNRNDWSY